MADQKDVRKIAFGSSSELYKQVFDCIEGEEVSNSLAYLSDGTTKIIERRMPNLDRWVKRAKDRSILTPLQLLAIIHFVIFDFEMSELDEERIVAQWCQVLLTAADSRDIVPRDSLSLLPLTVIPLNLDWILSLSDAEKFITAQGMEWTCAEIIQHLYSEVYLQPTVEADQARQADMAPQKINNSLTKKLEWVRRAQELASEYLSQWRNAGYTGTGDDAALYVENVFCEKGIYNTRQEPIDRATIKREALSGITRRKPGERTGGKKIPSEKRGKLP